VLFLMGDSYRKSASLLDVKLAIATNDGNKDPKAAVDSVEATAAKRDRLTKAKGLYDRVVDLYRNATAAPSDTDRLYMKLAHFYRADCLYDLGAFDDAIRAYDAAAFRYQEDPSALAAYVQIVNSYCALGRVEEAKTANERAKWLLRRMPQESFTDGSFSMPKAYWEQWLKWTSASGMW
jgi:tetratricopeptide (TPR) repeat protein